MNFFYGISSGNSARSLFALNEARVDFTPHAVHVPHGESRTAEYLALNPMGKVPAIVDGAVQLWESNAINWYIAETHPESRLLPATPAGRASVQRWMLFQTGSVTPACMAVYRSTNARVQRFWGVIPSVVDTERGRQELARYLPVLDDALEGREWLEGEFSLADIAYAPHLWLLGEGGFDFSPTPRVGAWLTRLFARAAWQKTFETIYGS